MDDDFCEYPRIIKKELPDFRHVAVAYWLRKEVCGNKKITVDDRRRHRVKSIKEPVGPTADLIQTYSFKYYPKSYDTLDDNFAGHTDVLDAAGNKTVYRYNADQRLTKLAYFGQEAKAYRTEKFYWGDKNNTNLLAHSITDQKGGVQLIHTFTYDGYGNPLKEHIYGNLTGENKRNPMLDAGGKIVETGCESHVKLCTYGHPSYNLKTSESEGIKKTTFSYYKGKDQVEAKLVYEGNTLKERHFYQYNSQGMLIKEVTDDGSQIQENDGTDIKLRTIHEVSPLKGSLSYLPEEEKYYYTKEDGQKVCVNRLFNHYDGKGRLTVQDHHDADDNLRYCLHWLYDTRGNVTEEVNAAGETTYRQYDAHNNLISEKGSHLPYHKKFAYDYMNRLICEETIDQETSYKITHTYDLRNNRVASTDWYGNETRFEYDAYNRLVKTIHPPIPKPTGELFYPTETLEYDVLGYVTKTCNGNGEATSQLMTIRGQPYLVNYPDGSTERMIYNLDGTLKEKTERNGMRTCYTYDYKDRILSSESFSAAGEPLGSHHYEYSAFHLLKETDAEGCTTSYTYNRQGQLISTLKENTAVHFTYDPLGRKSSVKTYFGYGDNDYTLTVYEYDLHDYIIEERQEDAFGTVLRKQTYTYDAAGNQTAKHTYSDAGISITTSTYDCHQQLTSVTDPEGHVTRTTYRYDYKDAHQLTVPYSETTDPKGNITLAICNTHHKIALLQVKNSLGQILQHREFFYDGIGQLIETREKVLKLDAFEREVINQWTYNSLGTVASCIEAVGTPEQKSTFHTFNEYSQKISTLKPDGTLLLFTYDGKGRLSTVLASDQTLSYAYTYDLNDNPILVQDLIHHTENTRSYDKCNRLIEETLGNGLTFKYVYDRQGRVHSVTIPDHSHVVYTYNATDLIEVKRVHISGEVLYSQSYSYDQAGNVIKKELPFNQGSISYTYDLRHQHQSIQSTHFSESKVTYDALGNLLTQTLTDPLGDLPCRYTYDDLHQLNSETSTTSHTYQHDSLYNRLVKDDQRFDFNSLHQLLGDKLGAYTYDPNGNLAERHEQKYTYDAWDRLLTVTQGNTRFSYTYDDLSRRLSKSKALWDSLTNTWLTQDVQYFLYQGNNEIGSCDAQHQLLEFRTLGQGLGAEIGAAIAFEIKGAVYIPLTNFAGHTQVLLNAQGEPCDIYRYTAFGEETITDAS
ncbi:MAG: RHS repeat protein, partial [Pseudanabaena sp. M57BS1SP1A06MG]|nr:RHS repeat protein [Pseudanabaena sp. M57BS1SP1A06MG]